MKIVQTSYSAFVGVVFDKDDKKYIIPSELMKSDNYFIRLRQVLYCSEHLTRQHQKLCQARFFVQFIRYDYP